MVKALVIGAGLAGLSAAYRLGECGWDVTVIEASDKVGGRARSARLGGYLIETGATQLSSGYRDYLALAHNLGLGGAIEKCSNKVMLMRDGRLYEIDAGKPLSLLFSGALTFGAKLKMLTAIRDYMAIKPRIDVRDVGRSWALDVESAETYGKRRLNTEIYNVLVDPLIRTYTINRGANVSVLEWYSGLENLAGNKMLALKGGVGRLAEALAKKNPVMTSTKATKATLAVGGGVEVEIETDGVRRMAAADACIVATRAFEAAAIVPCMKKAFDALTEKLRYNRAVVVHLGFARPLKTKALGILLSTAEHPQIGLVWIDSNKLPETAPEGHALVTCYFEEGGLDTVSLPTDENFISIAESFVVRLFPELAGGRDMANVTRWESAIPNPAPGAYRAVHEFKEKLDPAAPIQFAGDYLTCTGQNSAIYWGGRAAKNVAASIGEAAIPPCDRGELTVPGELAPGFAEILRRGAGGGIGKKRE